MGSKIGGDDESQISEINVTPFVDIILVILIVFMVTTPMIMRPGINIQLPKAASGEESSPSKLDIAIGANGELELNGKATNEAEISSVAGELFKANPEVQAVVRADKLTPHGTVIQIVDAMRTSGVKKFAFTTEKK